MLFIPWITVAAFAVLPLTVVAQTTHRFDPADPKVPVAAPVYQSAFQAVRPAADQAGTPDQVWRAANQQMGMLGGHAGHIQDTLPAAAVPPAATLAPDGARRHRKGP